MNLLTIQISFKTTDTYRNQNLMPIEQTKSVPTNYVVYKHTSPSGKSYIGLTNNLKRRNDQHQSKSNKCRLFAKAISKYGFDSFTHEILATGLTIQSANHFEEFYIKHFNSISPNGYNLRSGGDAWVISEESKKMRSGENNIWFGKFGANNPGAKHYLIISNNGVYETITGLKKWCRINCVNQGNLSSVAKGNKLHHMGYYCEELSHLEQYTEEELQEKGRLWENKMNTHKNRCPRGPDNKKSKKYVVTNPEGKQVLVYWLNKFCIDNGLSIGRMYSVSNGRQKKHLEFFCEHFDESKHSHIL